MTAATNRGGAPVFVLAATNRLADCDPALLRRFDRKILVPPPDATARAAFFASAAARPEVAAALRCGAAGLRGGLASACAGGSALHGPSAGATTPACPAPGSADDVAGLAAETEGCTGSDLAVVCREAVMAPLRELVRGAGGGGVAAALAAAAGGLRPVAAADFVAAVARLHGG